jgi:two-component system, OmpR family, response regulator
VDVVRNAMPDLILCDIRMPGLDGYQVLQAVRELPGGFAVVFIFLTAKVESEEIRAGMNLGADDYLLKPVTHKDLMTAIRVRLEHRRNVLDEIREDAESRMTEQLEFSVEDVKSILSVLSKTERRIFYYVAQEKSTSEIAGLMYVSPKTVENHRHNISKKLKLTGGHSVLALALKTKPVLQQLM